MNEIIVFTAKYLIYILAGATVVAAWYHLADKRKFFDFLFQLAGSLVIILLVELLLTQLFPTARPFVVDAVTPLFPHNADNSFPSSHAAQAALLASFIWQLRRDWGLVAFGAAFLIGLARVLSLVHYPVDIAGGFVIGIGTAYLVSRFWPRKLE